MCALSYMNKQTGENALCTSRWFCDWTMNDVPRREYLENLGCHDPVFGCGMYEVCCQVWCTKDRVDRCPGCRELARNVMLTCWKFSQIPCTTLLHHIYTTRTTIDTRLRAPHFARHVSQRHQTSTVRCSQDFRVTHLANLVSMDTKSRKCERFSSFICN